MTRPLLFIFSILLIHSSLMAQTDVSSVHDFTVESITGDSVSLSDFEGKVLVVVNVASKCGLTPQYEDLQRFQAEYEDQGVTVLGFPANDFMGQEPGSNAEIQEFCSTNFGVTFPMFSKISVKGREQHPLYEYLEAETNQKPTWNFHKYLINQNGEVMMSISPQTSIYAPEVIAKIQELLEA